VQRRYPPVAGVQRESDLGPPLGAKDQGWRLDLDFKAELARAQARSRLVRGADIYHGLDLARRAHLRQSDLQPVGQRTGLQQGGQEQVERAQSASPGGLLQTFEP
jgi:hypothetical protein